MYSIRYICFILSSPPPPTPPPLPPHCPTILGAHNGSVGRLHLLPSRPTPTAPSTPAASRVLTELLPRIAGASSSPSTLSPPLLLLELLLRHGQRRPLRTSHHSYPHTAQWRARGRHRTVRLCRASRASLACRRTALLPPPPKPPVQSTARARRASRRGGESGNPTG